MSKEMLELADEIEYCVERGIDAHLTAKSLTIISAALRASAVAEPVAWRVDGIRDGKQQVWFYWKPEWPGMHEEQGDMVTPLYAHPAPAALSNYNEQALSKFLWENCGFVSPSTATELARQLLGSYRIQPIG